MESVDLEKRVRALYASITGTLIEKKITVTTMESCTGGQIASLLTDTEGASAVFPGAFVTYSNKTKILRGVPAEVISRYGVYSEQTASAMASACRNALGCDLGIGITGTFGNVDPNNPDSVAGQVWFALELKGRSRVYARELAPQSSRLAYKLTIAEQVGEALMRDFLEEIQ